MYVTYPLTLHSDEIWLFVEYDEPLVDVFRLGVHIETGTYCTFPPDLWHTDSLVPVYRRTGEPSPEFRWACTTDLEINRAYPGFRYTHR